MILDGSRPESIERAAEALVAGELVGLPTETVYGLAADAGNPQAVQSIFAAKSRPATHPLIVHVTGASAAAEFAREIPACAQRLMDTFWPGPLTLILPRRDGVAEAAAGGHPTIGLRAPAHPVAQRLLAACAARDVSGLAAPSANRFGGVSPTAAAHVEASLGAGIMVLDGGVCEVGIESSIVDCSRDAPVLLRPGQLGRAEIERVAGERLRDRSELVLAEPSAPGTLAAHYAPQARLRLMDARELGAALDILGGDARNIAVWSRTPLKNTNRELLLRRMPDDAAAAAHELFAVLRAFDDAGARLIWVETPPPDAAWDGVRDRLQRAAASA